MVTGQMEAISQMVTSLMGKVINLTEMVTSLMVEVTDLMERGSNNAVSVTILVTSTIIRNPQSMKWIVLLDDDCSLELEHVTWRGQ